MKSLKRRVWYGIVKGAEAGFFLASLYLFLFISFAVVATLITGGSIAGAVGGAFLALMYGSLIGIPPSVILGGLSGSILGLFIELLYPRLTLNRAQGLALFATGLVILCLMAPFVFGDIIGAAVIFVILPAPFYIGAGVWLSRRLYLMEQEVPFREMAVIPLANGESDEDPVEVRG